MTLAEALVQLREMTGASDEPVIGDGDLTVILDGRKRVKSFRVGDWYGAGDLVLPSAADPAVAAGTVYITISAGMADLEPSPWLMRGGTIVQATGLVLKPFKGYDGNPYDLRAAAHAVFQRKAAREASEHNYSDAQQREDRDTLMQHFLDMAKQYAW